MNSLTKDLESRVSAARKVKGSKEVEKGSITNVTVEGKDKTNTMWYVKK